MKIRWKINLPVVIIVAVCSLTSAIISKEMLEQSVTASLTSELNNSTSSIALLFDNFFKSNINLAETCADTFQATDILSRYSNTGVKDNKEAIEKIKSDQEVIDYCARLNKIAKQYNLIAVYLLNKDGEIISGQKVDKVGGYRGDRKYFKELVKTQKPVISEILKSRTTGKLTVVVCAPVFNSSKKFIGGILVAFNYLDFYNDAAGSLSLLEGEYPYIFTESNNLIAHPDPEVIEKYAVGEPAPFSFFEKLKNGKGELVEYEFPEGSNNIRVSASSMINSTGWIVGLSGNKALRYATASHITWVILITTIIAVVIISLAVYLLVKFFIEKPVRVLLDHLEEYSRGNVKIIEKHLPVLNRIRNSKDEFGEMTRAVGRFREYIQKNISTASEIAKGNLCVDIDVVSENDMFGNEFSQMTQELRNAFSKLDKFTCEVSERVEMVSEASHNLSDKAIKQEESLIEIYASIASMEEKANENSAAATSANSITSTASKTAEKGNNLMSELSDSITNITSRAEDTQKVVKNIDDIAFQTNLLALNAAVEAARAGAHGKGFSVVAQEVKSLAMRSAEAAGETAALIENMIKEVKTGNELAALTVEILTEISGEVKEATAKVSEIEQSSRDQVTAISEINIGINNIEQITLENTESAKQTANASSDMKEETHNLKEVVSHFKHDMPVNSSTYDKPKELGYSPDNN